MLMMKGYDGSWNSSVYLLFLLVNIKGFKTIGRRTFLAEYSFTCPSILKHRTVQFLFNRVMDVDISKKNFM